MNTKPDERAAALELFNQLWFREQITSTMPHSMEVLKLVEFIRGRISAPAQPAKPSVVDYLGTMHDDVSIKGPEQRKATFQKLPAKPEGDIDIDGIADLIAARVEGRHGSTLMYDAKDIVKTTIRAAMIAAHERDLLKTDGRW